MEDLSFRYPGTKDLVLDGVDLTIRPGEIVALVGRNGSGKTTLTKLLCRLYDPTGGRITIDGIDLRDFETQALRRQLSVIYQDFGRYHMSARENILLGSPELAPGDPAVVAAAQWAGIHDEILDLPRGYDTSHEPQPRRWRGTEHRPMAEARTGAGLRARLPAHHSRRTDKFAGRRGGVRLFPEVPRNGPGRSALIISHRFSTVRLADRVYVLDGGRL